MLLNWLRAFKERSLVEKIFPQLVRESDVTFALAMDPELKSDV